MTMEENKKNLAEGDWELSEEYYHQDSSEKTLNLEDFIEAEEPDGSEEETFGKDDELGVELSRVAEQVRQTMEFTAQGMSAEEIARASRSRGFLCARYCSLCAGISGG